MIVYKLTDLAQDSLFAHNSCASVHYEIGMKSVRPPRCGPLAAFLSISKAEPWAPFWSNTRLYKCRAKRSSATGLWVNDREAGRMKQTLPEGTVLCDYIKPIELLYKRR